MQTPIHQDTPTNQNESASIACRLWEQAGHPIGLDLEFWLKAE
jgi:hypothetical protein